MDAHVIVFQVYLETPNAWFFPCWSAQFFTEPFRKHAVPSFHCLTPTPVTAHSHPGMNLAAVSSSDHALCTVYVHIDFLVTLVCMCSFCHIFLQLIWSLQEGFWLKHLFMLWGWKHLPLWVCLPLLQALLQKVRIKLDEVINFCHTVVCNPYHLRLHGLLVQVCRWWFVGNGDWGSLSKAPYPHKYGLPPKSFWHGRWKDHSRDGCKEMPRNFHLDIWYAFVKVHALFPPRKKHPL